MTLFYWSFLDKITGKYKYIIPISVTFSSRCQNSVIKWNTVRDLIEEKYNILPEDRIDYCEFDEDCEEINWED